jgi:hypothetical protein
MVERASYFCLSNMWRCHSPQSDPMDARVKKGKKESGILFFIKSVVGVLDRQTHQEVLEVVKCGIVKIRRHV